MTILQPLIWNKRSWCNWTRWRKNKSTVLDSSHSSQRWHKILLHPVQHSSSFKTIYEVVMLHSVHQQWLKMQSLEVKHNSTGCKEVVLWFFKRRHIFWFSVPFIKKTDLFPLTLRSYSDLLNSLEGIFPSKSVYSHQINSEYTQGKILFFDQLKIWLCWQQVMSDLIYISA